MQIIIYSTTTCAYCKLIQNYLTSRNINFEIKLIDQDEAAQKEMSELSNGYMGVPYTIVKKDDGTTENILGFDKGKLDTIIKKDNN